MVVWDFHARKPIQTLEVPGAPLEIRWALQPRHNYAFTSTALTSKLWLIEQQPDGTFTASAVADIGDPTKTPLPVDISLVGRRPLPLRRHVHGRHRCASSTSPTRSKPKQVVHEQKIGSQVNMVSQTWDGERVYFTSSLLANWDKTGEGQRAVPEGLSLGRQDAHAALRRRLPCSEARPAAPSCTSARTSSTRTRSTPPPRRGSPASRDSERQACARPCWSPPGRGAGRLRARGRSAGNGPDGEA